MRAGASYALRLKRSAQVPDPDLQKRGTASRRFVGWSARARKPRGVPLAPSVCNPRASAWVGAESRLPAGRQARAESVSAKSAKGMRRRSDLGEAEGIRRMSYQALPQLTTQMS